MNERNFDSIPAKACRFSECEFIIGDNGEKSKTAPIKLTARSGKPIEHWFWGRVVHDLAGMRLHKSRLPVDYAHDDKEVIGYLNRFDTQSGDLVVSGALVPFKDTDRATEIIHKNREGVPYEASINFGGDGIKIEEVPEGFVAQVNGYAFDGPGVIIREWPLRGVAICPYGADANTNSSVLSGSESQKYAATVIKSQPLTAKEENEMSTSVDVAAEVKEETVAENLTAVEAVVGEEGKPVEDTPAETAELTAPVVETETPEGEEEKPVVELSRDEFLQIVKEFGADVAAQTVADGGGYVEALKLAAGKLKKENADLRAQVDKLATNSCGTPAPVNAAQKTEKQSLFKTGK